MFFKKILNQIINALVINLLSIFKLKTYKKNLINSKHLRSVCLIEIQFHNIFMIIIYYYLSLILNNRFQIIFFYYSRIDNKILNQLYNYVFYFYFNRLKKKIGASIINFYKKPSNKDFLEAKSVFKKIKSKKDVSKIKIRNYKIGRFIYQSYCRELMEETVNIKDKRLISYIAESINLIKRLELFFSKHKIRKVYISHTIFIRFGIICSVAKKCNAKIRLIYQSNRNGLLKQLTVLKVNDDLIQQERYWKFKKNFRSLTKSQRKIGLLLSKKDLEKRINLNFISYKLMVKNSPYSKKNIINIYSDKPKVIILPSCFYDVVNFFRFKLFEDNYTWLINLLELAKKTNFDWYIKPHPDGFPENKKKIIELKNKYPFLKILPSKTSNLSFKVSKFSSMFTFHGSAIHEFAYMGIPSVSVSDNIHINYNFGKPLLSYKKFKKAVLNADKIKLNLDKNDIYELNYMFNFDKSPDLIKVNFLNRKDSSILSKYYLNTSIFNIFRQSFYLDSLIRKKQLSSLIKLTRLDK